MLIQIGLYDEAAQVLEEYVRGAPNDFDGHYQLGMALEIQAERLTTRRRAAQLRSEARAWARPESRDGALLFEQGLSQARGG